MMLKNKEDEAFLADTNTAHLTGTSKFGHYLIWCSLAFIVVGLLWSYLAEIDEVTRAQGTVVPTSKVQIVQNLEGGIVKQILVKEGQTVKKGHILMILDDTRFSSEARASQLKTLSLRLKIARLDAELSNKPFTPSDEFKKAIPDLTQSESSLYQSRRYELKTIDSNLALIRKEIQMTKPLVKEGAASPVEVIRLEQRFHELQTRRASFLSATQQERNKAKEELQREQQNSRTLKDRLERTEVKSPINGIIKQIHINTIGGVVKPGMELAEVVPIEDTLRIEARIKPDDIGFIEVGQKATVKITAYDFAIYGGMDGTVEHISADSSMDKDGNNYFEVWVRTKKNYIEGRKKKLAIIPGMQASVDIITGKKSILDYILKPILRAKQRALREK